MFRYQDDDSETGRNLLIAAGVVAGLLAGAALSSRFGGLKGMRRALSRRRGPLIAAVRAALPSRALRAVLDVVGIDEILDSLLGEVPQRRKKLRTRRPIDPDLDEYEVEDDERTTRTVDRYDDANDDDLDEAYSDYEDEEEDDDDLDAPNAQLRRFRHADASDLEDEFSDEDEADDEDDEEEEEEEEEEDDAVAGEQDDGGEVGDDEEEDVDDEALTRAGVEGAVLAAFRRHSLLRQRALQIAVDDDGVVELTGWVRRERDLRVARRVARRVPGVTRVTVDVSVRDVVQLVPHASSKGA